jgi:hypothetical protein
MGLKSGQEELNVLNVKIVRVLPVLLILMFGGVKFAKAQSGDIYFGVGTAMDSASKTPVVDPFTGADVSGPKMTGTFGTFGATYMFRPTFGFGGEYSFRFSQGSYAGLDYRPKFYDFNAIWMPFSNSKKVVPEFQGGIGGASLSFYYPQQCISGIACSSSSFLVSSSHFQEHFSGGVRFYVKGGVFIRPQVDVHYVNNFYQFGSGFVPEYSIALGYTFGRQ